ncbi:hypothetical protein K456DRAFT_772352 [Colletotrichum gloeosporioides 23]|nr:hypothetical protein K456DRAFT_772352 [Colletotrichum gloeosporioides 23]
MKRTPVKFRCQNLGCCLVVLCVLLLQDAHGSVAVCFSNQQKPTPSRSQLRRPQRPVARSLLCTNISTTTSTTAPISKVLGTRPGSPLIPRRLSHFEGLLICRFLGRMRK